MFATTLHALADCEACVAAARAGADLAHQIADLEAEHEILVIHWERLSAGCGRLAA